MVSSSDLISLAFDPDLVQAGVAVAGRWYWEPAAQALEPGYPQMRDRVAQICLDLAFRRYISQEGIPHRFLDATPFSAPHHQDIALGGRRCLLVHRLVTRPSLLERLQQEPAALLASRVFGPQGTAFSPQCQHDDLVIFGFLFGRVTPNLRSLQKAQAADLPAFLVYRLPPRWRQARPRRSLGVLSLSNDSSQTISLALNGQGDDRKPRCETLSLPPGEMRLELDFTTLSSLRADTLPTGDIRLHSPAVAETCRVRPVDWGNLWIYGQQIVLAGYLTGVAYQQAAHQPPGRRARQAMPVSALKPLPDLFERVKAWRAV